MPDTFAQRVAWNHCENVVPWPAELVLAETGRGDASPAEIVDGLESLHRFILDVYALAARSPESFHLPSSPDVPPRDGSAYSKASLGVRHLPRLLFALGLLGEARCDEGEWCLVTALDDLRGYCKDARLPHLAKLLSDFEAAGMLSTCAPAEDEPGSAEYITTRFPGAPKLALGLSVFAAAARRITKDVRHPPDAFRRADMRMMQAGASPTRPPAITIEDVTAPLDETQAQVLRALAARVEELGYRPQLKCSGLARGEWRGSYVNSKLGRTLFGLVVEEGCANARIVIDDSGAIFPAIAKLPVHLRDAVLRRSACRGCGRCEEPVKGEIDGTRHALCRSLSLWLPDIAEGDTAHLLALIDAQDRVLCEGAAG